MQALVAICGEWYMFVVRSEGCKRMKVNVVVEEMAYTGGIADFGGGDGIITIPFQTVTTDFRVFCENVAKDGLFYCPGHWVSPSCVKAVWVVE